MTDLNEQINAAEKYAEQYNDDPRDHIKTDVINAFYAGVDWNRQHGSAAQAVAKPYGWVYDDGHNEPRLSFKQMPSVLRGWTETPVFAAPPVAAQAAQPVDMILHCPACGLQHVDEPDERTPDWNNPPHRSHLCHGCGHIWRPADVPTNGVRALATRGKNDSPIAAPPVADAEGVKWVDEWMGRNDVVLKQSAYRELCAALSRRPAAEQPAAEQAKAAHVDWRNEKDGRPAAAGNALTDAFAQEQRDELVALRLDGATWRPCARDHADAMYCAPDVHRFIEQHLRAAPQATQGEGLTEITLLNGSGGTLRREACNGGGHAWHVWNLYSPAGNLMRTLDKYEKALVDSAIAAHTRASDGKEAGPTPEIMVIAAARALADRHAAACNVDKDDNWKINSDFFIADARAAIDAAMKAGAQGGAA